MPIVPATIDQIRPIYAMMRTYVAETVDKCGYSLQWSDGRAALHIGSLLESDSNMSFITSGYEGMILGRMGETWFGPNPIAKPEALYVLPAHRNGLIARALLRKFESEAKARGARYILWEFESGLSNVKMLGGLMEKLGYDYQGPIYLKRLGETCQQ